MKFIFLLALLFLTNRSFPQNNLETEDANILTDNRDGKKYHIIQIGHKYWMLNSLDYVTGASYGLTEEEKMVHPSPGRYYSFTEREKVCPDGWELPTAEDWLGYFNFFIHEDMPEARLEKSFGKYPKEFALHVMNKEFDLFRKNNPLDLKATTRVEGGKWKPKGDYADYWAVNNFSDQPELCHAHVGKDGLNVHSHKHNLELEKPDKLRKFMVRCVKDAPDTLVKKAIRVEYNALISDYDPLLNYAMVPIKKILTITKGEALLEIQYREESSNQLLYYDLDRGLEFYGFSIGQTIYKREWEKKGELIGGHNEGIVVLKKNCNRMKIKTPTDTLEVLATEEYGLDFCLVADIKGLALQYDVLYPDIGKIKFRATNINGGKLNNNKLIDFSGLTVLDLRQDRFQKMKKRNEEREEEFKLKTEKVIGSKAPNFSSKTLEGEKVSLKSGAGKIRVLNFWFTQCHACITEMGSLNKVVGQFKGDENVDFISFCLDEDKTINDFLQKNKFEYKICPESLPIAERYETTVYPLNVVINQEGEIVEYIIGDRADIAKHLIKTINELKNK